MEQPCLPLTGQDNLRLICQRAETSRGRSEAPAPLSAGVLLSQPREIHQATAPSQRGLPLKKPRHHNRTG